MKMLQRGYNEIQAIEVELRTLEQTSSAPPSRPREFCAFLISAFRLYQYKYIFFNALCNVRQTPIPYHNQKRKCR